MPRLPNFGDTNEIDKNTNDRHGETDDGEVNEPQSDVEEEDDVIAASEFLKSLDVSYVHFYRCH